MPLKINFSSNDLYRNHYHHFIMALMALIVVFFICIVVVFYQLNNRPIPQFFAMTPEGKETLLVPYNEPNLLPTTILNWASKAATLAYTFDFVNYERQTLLVKPYFTEKGWIDYSNSVNSLIDMIVKNQIFVYGVVVGAPVISNEGQVPSRGYVWRVQIPFLVTYVSTGSVVKRNYYVILSIVRVPTNINQQGIGIDQFVMV